MIALAPLSSVPPPVKQGSTVAPSFASPKQVGRAMPGLRPGSAQSPNQAVMSKASLPARHVSLHSPQTLHSPAALHSPKLAAPRNAAATSRPPARGGARSTSIWKQAASAFHAQESRLSSVLAHLAEESSASPPNSR